MPFERKTLIGPDGIYLHGPDEHIGESEHHWLGKYGPKAKQSDVMYLRIEKRRSLVKEYDDYSPIVRLLFNKDSLEICHVGPSVIKKHILQNTLHSKCGFNPYLNREQDSLPKITIPLGFFQGKGYDVNCQTDFRGDFITLTSVLKSSPKPQTIIINLWAVGLLEGLDEIRLGGSVFIKQNIVVGEFPTEKKVLPFFEVISMMRSEDQAKEQNRFIDQSYDTVLKLLRKRERYSGYLQVEGFLNIDMTIEDDRSSVPFPIRRKKGVAEARKLFTKLFGKK